MTISTGSGARALSFTHETLPPPWPRSVQVPRRDVQLVGFQWLRALDCPERLEWVLELDEEAAPEILESLVPGGCFASSLPGLLPPRDLRLESVTHRERPGRPARLSLVAYAPFEARRRDLPSRAFSGGRLDDLARGVAADLGLHAHVEPLARHVPPGILTGNRLGELRRQAYEAGAGLAVRGHTLYLGRELDDVGESWRIGPWTGFQESLRESTLRLGVSGERRLVLHLEGVTALEPLDRVDVDGLGARRSGTWRVRRVELDHGTAGWSSVIELASGGEAGRWLASGEGAPS